MKGVIGALLGLIAAIALPQEAPRLVVLEKGSGVPLKMAQTLSAKHAYMDQRVELVVSEDVVVDGEIVIPKKTRVLGTVTFGKEKEGKKNNPHDVVIRIDYIRLNGRRIRLTGDYAGRSKVNQGAALAATAVFGLPGLMIAMDTRAAEIKEGTEVIAAVAEDVELPSKGKAPLEKVGQ